MYKKEEYEKKSMISLGELKDYFFISSNNVCIPLLQRNYKWDREYAAELSEDLINQYLQDKEKKETDKKGKVLSLITLFISETKVEIIDGQQRLITLSILLSYIGKYVQENILPNFYFERDNTLIEGDKRKRFVEDCFMCPQVHQCEDKYLYTDRKRMYNNYYAMIFPITVRYFYSCYEDFINNNNNELNDDAAKDYITKELKKRCTNLSTFFEFHKNTFETNKNIEVIISQFKEHFLDKIYYKIKEIFIKGVPLIGTKESDECMNLIVKWKESFIDSLEIKKEVAEEFNEYINKYIKFYCNFTTSEPIDEFLNINENKTSFVISDYVKAKLMIELASQTKCDDESETREKQEKRLEILKTFNEISNYFYNPSYKRLWDIVKRGYLEEEFKSKKEFKDMENVNSSTYEWENCENRLKVIFYDRYNNNSLMGLDPEKEYQVICRFNIILKKISELCDDNNKNNQFLYNALWTLYLCTHERFFYIFSKHCYTDMIDNVEDIIRQEYFVNTKHIAIEKTILKITCDANGKKNTWYNQYFLESIMHSSEYKVDRLDYILKEDNQLPVMEKNTFTNEWIYWDNSYEVDDIKKIIDIFW